MPAETSQGATRRREARSASASRRAEVITRPGAVGPRGPSREAFDPPEHVAGSGEGYDPPERVAGTANDRGYDPPEAIAAPFEEL